MTNSADAITPPGLVRTDGNQEKAATRTRRARTSSGEESDGGARFLLAKPGGNDGLLALDREVANESKALVKAPGLGVSFYAVQEFRVIPGRRPQLNKEAVRGG